MRCSLLGLRAVVVLQQQQPLPLLPPPPTCRANVMAVPPHPYTHQAGMFPPPNPHQWAPGGAYGGIRGPPRFPNPYTMHQQPQAMHQQQQQPMHQLPQQPMAHPWLYNQWTMLPDNRYGVPQNEMDQNWFIPNPSSKHSLWLVLINSYAAEQY